MNKSVKYTLSGFGLGCIAGISQCLAALTAPLTFPVINAILFHQVTQETLDYFCLSKKHIGNDPIKASINGFATGGSIVAGAVFGVVQIPLAPLNFLTAPTMPILGAVAGYGFSKVK